MNLPWGSEDSKDSPKIGEQKKTKKVETRK